MSEKVKRKKEEITKLSNESDELEQEMERLEEQMLKKKAYNTVLRYLNLKEEAAIDEFQYKFV